MMTAKEKLQQMFESLKKENEELKESFISREEYEADMEKVATILEKFKENFDSGVLKEQVTEETEEEEYEKEEVSSDETPQDEPAATSKDMEPHKEEEHGNEQDETESEEEEPQEPVPPIEEKLSLDDLNNKESFSNDLKKIFKF